MSRFGPYRSSPSVSEAFEAWRAANPTGVKVHSLPWDVSDPDLYAEDRWHAPFREMRSSKPVNKVVGSPYGDYWNVVTLKGIQEIEACPEIYSSSWRHGGIVIVDTGLSDEETGRAMNFLSMDPPEHTPRRRAVAGAFTPSEMQRLTSRMRNRTGEVLDDLPQGEQFDWVERVSIELTTGMLAILFDFPWDQRRQLTFWSDWMSDIEIEQSEEVSALRMEIMQEMASCFQAMWQERANGPPSGDLFSMMIHSDAMSQMSPGELMSNMALLIVGGNDTTRNTMTGMVEALNRFPDQRTRLETDHDVIPNAVHEFIRFVTPVAHMRRTALADVEFMGEPIKAGDKLILWYISGNRDESVFENADKLILDRANASRHVSFGYGIHRCIGARLAELQLRILLEELVARRIRVHVTGKIERLKANFIHGFRRLEATVERY